jgi:hypothetical protein
MLQENFLDSEGLLLVPPTFGGILLVRQPQETFSWSANPEATYYQCPANYSSGGGVQPTRECSLFVHQSQEATYWSTRGDSLLV